MLARIVTRCGLALGWWIAACCGQLAWAQAQPGPPQAQQGAERPQGQDASLRYRVNYRPSETNPWQVYSETRSLEQANAIAADVRSSGYLAEVVDSSTPAPQMFPDA